MTIRKGRWAALLLVALWIGFILLRSAKSASESNEESLALLEWLRRLFPGLTNHFVRKAAHFTEYFILGALLCAAWRLLGRGNALLPLGLCAAVACVDEFLIQVNTPGRSGELGDVLLDTLGALAGLGICLLLCGRRGRRRDGRAGKES